MTRVVFITLLSLFFHFPLHAQVDTKGTDFWLTFGRNSNITNYTYVNLQIRVVGNDQATTGTIYFTNLGTSVPFTVAAGQVYTHNLSDSQKQAVYNGIAGISNRSVHITSSYPITVYALNQASMMADATNALPITALGTDYYYISYIPVYSLDDAYAIVATQDNTQVYHNGTPSATLNTGDVYYHISTSDMTGAHITANKPIAFFAVNQGTIIPYGGGTIDNLFQQLAPVNTWGKNFFVPVSHCGKDRVRIMVAQNGTNITQTGGIFPAPSPPAGGQATLSNLNAGQWVELEVSSANNGCYIQADKPVGVCAYLTTSNYNGSMSDPAEAWVPAIEQTVKSALIAPFIPAGTTTLNAHYALVITPTATKNNTTVKIGAGAAQALSSGTWYDNATADMSFYSMSLINTTAAYLFSNQAGLVIMGYGTGIGESYYYLASSALRTLDAAFYVNDIHYQDLAAEIICSNSPVWFHAEISGDISTAAGFLKWYIDGMEETAAQDQLDWNTTFTPGTYQIKMVVLMDDGTPKTVSATLTVIAPTPPIVVNNPTICSGEAATLTVTNPVSGATYTWYNATGLTSLGSGVSYTTPALTGTINYVVRVAGVNCPPEPTTVTVTVTPLTLIIVNNPTICYGETATLTVTNPVAGATYTWYDATGLTSLGNGVSYTTPALTGTINYVVKVTGVDCPDAPTTVTVTVTPLTPIIVNNLTICSGEMATLTVTNPVSGATYTWYDATGLTPLDNGVSYTTPALTYTTDYVVKVTGVDCPDAPTTVTVTVTPLTLIIVDNPAICSGETATLTVTNPVAGATYTWYDATGLTSLGNGASYTTPALTSTINYVVKVTGVDCPAPTTVTVMVNPLPVVTLTAYPEIVCSGGPAVLTASVGVGATSSMSYTWYEGATLLETNTVNTYIVSALTATATYSVEVVNSNGCSNTSNTTTVTVTVNPLPVTSLTASPEIVCSGEASTLTATVTSGLTTAMSYTWYEGSNLLGTTAENTYTANAITAATTYSVWVVNSHGCFWISNTVTVAVNPLPIVSITASSTYICSGDAVILTADVGEGATSSMTYTWYEGSTLMETNTVNTYAISALTATTNYSVEVVNSNGCIGVSNTVTVTVNPLPVVNITASSTYICSGDAVTLTATVSGGTTTAMTYTWYEGTTLLETTTDNTYTISALTTTATYSVEVINSNGCIGVSNTVTITVNPLPVTSLTAFPEIVCSGEASTLTATVTSGLTTAMSYTWYEGTTLLETTTENTYATSALTATTTYSVEVVNSYGCVWVSNTVTVTVNPLPVVSITASSTHVCSGDAATLTATVSGGTTTAMTYTWYSDATPIATTMENTYNLNVLATNYSVEVVNSHNCSGQGSITISVTLPPSVTAMDDQRICYGEEITLTTLAEDGDIISWNVPQTTVRLTASTYFIVTASRPPCPDAKDTVRITVGDSLYIFPSKLPSFQRNRFYEQQLQTNAASPLFTIVAGALPEGLLLHGNGIINGIPPLIQQEEKNYTFTVQVLDAYDCTGTITYLLYGELLVPAVFSPNGDERNDYFMKSYKVIIFDRLGVKIFEGNDGWDGTYNGRNAPQDTYFYILFYIDANGRETKKNGSVTLLR